MWTRIFSLGSQRNPVPTPPAGFYLMETIPWQELGIPKGKPGSHQLWQSNLGKLLGEQQEPRNSIFWV